MKKSNIFITTSLPYANSKGHAGHSLEFILADILARFHRQRSGDESVYFNVGLDEHGKKIEEAAALVGLTPKKYVDAVADSWIEFCSTLGITYNNFYRTSSIEHYQRVSLVWHNLHLKGLIYKKEYSGKYCVGCESFKTPRELVDDKCTDHPSQELKIVNEENYFLALSKFKESLIAWVNAEASLLPTNKNAELFGLIDGLEDLSISRKVESVSWGVPVPGDKTQVVYIWLEALCNYLFAAGYLSDEQVFANRWSGSIQLFGPDNLKFQAVIFQALLEALELPHTNKLLCHGTILDSKGAKMSKTEGNVVDPLEQISKYGIDAVRYYTIAGLNAYSNSSWDEERLVEVYNAHLANNYGNLVSRVVHLCNIKNVQLEGEVSEEALALLGRVEEAVLELVECNFAGYVLGLNDVSNELNKYLADNTPWAKDSVNYELVLRSSHKVLVELNKWYATIVPGGAAVVSESLVSLEKNPAFPRLEFKK